MRGAQALHDFALPQSVAALKIIKYSGGALERGKSGNVAKEIVGCVVFFGARKRHYQELLLNSDMDWRDAFLPCKYKN